MTSPTGVVVLDDIFPDLATGFRVAEFNWLMRRNAVSRVLTTQPLLHQLPPYAARYPEFVDRIGHYSKEELAGASLAWMTFLNNAAYYLDDLEETGTPFVVTLYPGGGLYLGDPEAERKLDRVLGSPLLRHVITTQPLVTEHVRERAPEVPVTEILGVVVSPLYLGPGAGFRTDYYAPGSPDGTPALRLAFAAHKYTEGGRDKGYDLFLDTVRGLRDAGVPLDAHVIGGFSEGDLDVSDLADVLTFHGVLETAELRSAYSTMDLIVSPNRPGVLASHAFDGFPLGSVVEAALCGAGIVATDALDQNRMFMDGRNILIVQPDADDIVHRILELMEAPGGIARLAQAGLSVARRHYGVDSQLWGRLRVMEAALAAEAAAEPAAEPVA
ncbi:glycosyltransferase [Leifsonia shinshuensis]|uniref:glycosyltransferase n=1 Tax=Leifsonia shinshuensis TaxID=150026 RepID=UPI00285D9004|nr:glycosyltransferase [Leifsonia shinshuensis]MDR6971587.1 glycosyltransferase involved in cell wall biosynthesis [Leifsonia shinshuensis]